MEPLPGSQFCKFHGGADHLPPELLKDLAPFRGKSPAQVRAYIKDKLIPRRRSVLDEDGEKEV